MFSHPAALLCNAGVKRGGSGGGREARNGGECGRIVAAHPLLLPVSRSRGSLLPSLAPPCRAPFFCPPLPPPPALFYIQSRHATMNSTNYVAFSFAALFDRLSARALPRRVIIPRREEESYISKITTTDPGLMRKLKGRNYDIMCILYIYVQYILHILIYNIQGVLKSLYILSMVDG